MTENPSIVQRRAGIVLTVLPALALIASAVSKFVQPPEAVDGFTKMGFDTSLLLPLGILELAITLIYLVPKTSFLGAILITGYMGGAICTHLRIGEPFLIQVAFGVVVWIGYGLRRPQVIRSAF